MGKLAFLVLILNYLKSVLKRKSRPGQWLHWLKHHPIHQKVGWVSTEAID